MLAYESSYSFCHNSNSSMLFGIEHIDFAFLSIFCVTFVRNNESKKTFKIAVDFILTNAVDCVFY